MSLLFFQTSQTTTTTTTPNNQSAIVESPTKSTLQCGHVESRTWVQSPRDRKQGVSPHVTLFHQSTILPNPNPPLRSTDYMTTTWPNPPLCRPRTPQTGPTSDAPTRRSATGQPRRSPFKRSCTESLGGKGHQVELHRCKSTGSWERIQLWDQITQIIRY